MRNYKYPLFGIILLIQSLLINRVISQGLDSLVLNSLRFAEQQLAATVAEIGDTLLYPYKTRSDGSWETRSPGSWVTGWFPGCLWYMYEWTGQDTWKTWAQKWTEGLEDSQYKTNSHDVGFIIFCSFGNGFRLTDRDGYREIILQAAQSLSTRYNSTVGCIQSWNRYGSYNFPVIVDNMMNLEILFWAAKNGGKSEWYDMAVSHSLRTMEDHVREDGSTYQIVAYDTTSGEVIAKLSKQGYSDESTWARGQAWGIYGFTMAYRESGDERFLSTAQRLSDFFIDNLPSDYIPFWDFDSPDTLKDASVAAIAASALLELCTLTNNHENKIKYKQAALNILSSLCSPAYLAGGTISSGILLHGIQNFNEKKGIDVSLIYADYYFIEALLRWITLPTLYSAKDQNFPSTVQLLQNYPNPFNSGTTIRYVLPHGSFISLNVYDINGRLVQKVVNSYQTQGEYRLFFDGNGLASGGYLAVLKVRNEYKIQKMMLIR
jgi:unsaturated chondroitin disaccharide hydrolase